MFYSEKSITIKERLSKLEDELDQLISIQEKTRNKFKTNIDSIDNTSKQCNARVNKSAKYTRNRVQTCLLSNTPTAPLSDISKFLQQINVNLSKGTQAVTKIANLTVQQNSNSESSKKYHDSCLKENNANNPQPERNALTRKAQNEDSLYKEIREEKEKRQRAENQIRKLKDEIKQSISELQQKADLKICLLQSELKEAVEKLEDTEIKLNRCYQDRQAAEYLWPFQYDNLCKELQDEQVKRKEAEINIITLKEKLQRQCDCVKENFKVKNTINWLRSQNQHLECLIEKLHKDIEDKQQEIIQKNQTLENNLRKIKQLTCVCEKLRDSLIVMKAKASDGEEKLKYNLIHCQKLSETLLMEQRKSDELKRRQAQGSQEQQLLLERIKTLTSSKEALQTSLDAISETMSQQKNVIDCQFEKLNNKDEQLKLAYENIKLQSQRISELENKTSNSYHEIENRQSIAMKDIDKFRLELECEKDNVLIKEKIIESHLQTTIKLKTELSENNKEINLLKRDILEKERQLAAEQNSNEELLSKVKSLQRCKQKLQQTIEELEEEVESQASTEQALRLDQIEKQVREKQKVFEENIELLNQEKKNLLEKLTFTTQKLEDTTVGFIKDLASHEKHIKDLQGQLYDKEQKLKQSFEKISNLTQELKDASEQMGTVEKQYQEKMKKACDAWQQTMQMLQS